MVGLSGIISTTVCVWTILVLPQSIRLILWISWQNLFSSLYTVISSLIKFGQEGNFGLRAAWDMNWWMGWIWKWDEYSPRWWWICWSCRLEEYLSDCLHQACDVCIRTLQWQNVDVDRNIMTETWGKYGWKHENTAMKKCYCLYMDRWVSFVKFGAVGNEMTVMYDRCDAKVMQEWWWCHVVLN